MDNVLDTPNGTVIIKPAIPTDASYIREIRLESLKNHPEVFASDYETSANETIDFWMNRITNYVNKNNGAIFIASNRGRLIGLTGINRSDHIKMRHNGNIWGVYVDAQWRGFRIADALVNECVSWAQTRGLIAVKLGVITSNTSAIHCYSRCGFNTYGVDPKVIHYNNIFHDELLMVKLLK